MPITINIPTQVAQTITNGVTATAPSQDAVFDALASLVTGVSSVNSLTGAVALTGTANRLTISAANVFDIGTDVVTLTGSQALTNKTIGGNTFTAGTGTLTLSTFTLTVAGTTSVNGTFSGTSSGTNTGDQTIASLSPLTTKGDIFTYSTVNTRLAVASGDGKILQVSSGAATGLAWSTPTYPSASGTSGKVLISDGTNNVYSTPTFPNASATSGKWITSDGTNWVASTPTLSSTPTSGTYLRGDGTNWITSTVTLPNSATTGDVLSVSASNVYANIAAVASGSLFASAGTGTLPAWSASPTLTTSLTTPLIIGGTTTTSTLTLKATTGVGTTNSDIIFQVGNNGATEAMRIISTGRVGIGASPLQTFQVTSSGFGSLFSGSNAGTASSNVVGMEISNTNATTGNFAGISFADAQNGSGSALMGAKFTNRSLHYADYYFSTKGADGFLDRWILNLFSWSNTGSVGTAYIDLRAGTATAGTAPLHFTSGTNLTTAVAGTMEYNGTDLFFTKTGTTRSTVLCSSAVTTEVIVSDTTLTITHAGTTYKILARA